MKLHKGLSYHKDEIPKHPLTDQEINFLANLQNEMNTQDTVGQRDPRFWVIRGTETVYGMMDGEQRLFLNGTEYSAMCDSDLVKNILEAARKNCTDYKDLRIKAEVDSMTLYGKGKEAGESEDAIAEWLDFENLVEWLQTYTREDARVLYCEDVPKIYPSTFFLTQKAAEEHLIANHYHYSQDAHTYAMTAWRNPEADNLWAILQETDFEDLRQQRRNAELLALITKKAEENGHAQWLRELLITAGATNKELAKFFSK